MSTSLHTRGQLPRAMCVAARTPSHFAAYLTTQLAEPVSCYRDTTRCYTDTNSWISAISSYFVTVGTATPCRLSGTPSNALLPINKQLNPAHPARRIELRT